MRYLTIFTILLLFASCIYKRDISISQEETEEELVVVKDGYMIVNSDKIRLKGAFSLPPIEFTPRLGPYIESAIFGLLENKCKLDTSSNICNFNFDITLEDLNSINKEVNINVYNNDKKNNLIFYQGGQEGKVKVLKGTNEFFSFLVELPHQIMTEDNDIVKISIGQKEKDTMKSNVMISKWLKKPIPVVIEPGINIRPGKEPFQVRINLRLSKIEPPFLVFDDVVLNQSGILSVSSVSKICNRGTGEAKIRFLNERGDPYVEWLNRPEPHFEIKIKDRKWEENIHLGSGECIEIMVFFSSDKKGSYNTMLSFEEINTKRHYNMSIRGNR